MAEYEGRSILVLGGSSGIGLEAVAEFKRLGADHVYVGTSNPAHYEDALTKTLQRRKKLDTSTGIHPFVADVTDKMQLATAALAIKRSGVELTDVIFSQAGGMEGFTEKLFSRHIDPIVDDYTLNTPMDELKPEEQMIVKERLTAMRTDLEVWTDNALPRAIYVNCMGTFNALAVLGETFSNGFRGIFYNSTWGHLSGQDGVEIPLLYRPVDRSKALVRDRLELEGQYLAETGIPMGVVVASLVKDTKVGKMFNDFLLNLMSKEQREAIVNSSIYARDVVRATREMLESSPKEGLSYPQISFVYGRNGQAVVEDHLEMSAMYTIPYLF